MAKSTSFIATLLLWGIVVIVLLNCILFFPWASVTHSATSDSIDRHEKLIASITDELNAVRTVTKELRAGNIGPFDKKVREALKGGSEEVQDYLNSPVFSEDAARRSDPQIKPDGECAQLLKFSDVVDVLSLLSSQVPQIAILKKGMPVRY